MRKNKRQGEREEKKRYVSLSRHYTLLSGRFFAAFALPNRLSRKRREVNTKNHSRITSLRSFILPFEMI
jgi:hypothetical protein